MATVMFSSLLVYWLVNCPSACPSVRLSTCICLSVYLPVCPSTVTHMNRFSWHFHNWSDMVQGTFWNSVGMLCLIPWIQYFFPILFRIICACDRKTEDRIYVKFSGLVGHDTRHNLQHFGELTFNLPWDAHILQTSSTHKRACGPAWWITRCKVYDFRGGKLCQHLVACRQHVIVSVKGGLS